MPLITKTPAQQTKVYEHFGAVPGPTPQPSVGPALKTPNIKAIVTRKTSDGIENRFQFHENELSPESRTVVAKIRVLRKYSQSTGYKTTRSQNDLLQTLDGNDLANALLVLNEE